MEVLLLVAERDGPEMLARIAVMKALNRHTLWDAPRLSAWKLEVGRWPTTGPGTIGVSSRAPWGLGIPAAYDPQVLALAEIHGLLSRWLAAHRQRRDARFLLRRSGRGIVKVRATDAPLRILRELVPAALRASAVLFGVVRCRHDEQADVAARLPRRGSRTGAGS